MQSHSASRRRLISALGLAGASPLAKAGWLMQLDQSSKEAPSMQAISSETFIWDVTFCSYGIDIEPRGQGDVTTLWTDNWMKDADGNLVAKFFTGFGAAWGAGASGMGGVNPKGSRLPKSLRLRYYDYLEDRFYQLDAELPLQRIYEFFKREYVSINSPNYGKVRGRFDDLRIGIAPLGHVMVWAAGLTDRVELQTYQALELPGMTAKSYNASLPGGTFTLQENRWGNLAAGKLSPATLERIKKGWTPDPSWYMRHIRVKFPWRFKLTGNVTRITELSAFLGNAEAQSVWAWEMPLYPTLAELRGIPDTCKFWFYDSAGTRHYVWVSFSLRERAVSESDLSEVRAAFDQVFPGRQLEDNQQMPGEDDMATVEVHIPDNFKGYTATLVKGNMRLPLPIGASQHFELKHGTSRFWRSDRQDTPEQTTLFLEGPHKR
jgi:hypothetical protein